MKKPSMSLPALDDKVFDMLDVQTITPKYFLMHYREFINKYIAHGMPSEDTLKSYCAHIDLFLRWCIEHKANPLGMTDYHMRVYRDYLIHAGYEEKSIALKIVAVRTFYKAAVKMDFIKENPADDIYSGFSHSSDDMYKYYTFEQIQKVLDICKEADDDFLHYRNALLVCMMGVEGLRNIELHRLNLEDINWGTKTIMIRGKGHNDMAYPNDQTFALIKKYLDALEADKTANGRTIQKDGLLTPLFLSVPNRQKSYKRLSRNGIRYIINDILNKADLKYPGRTCHIFRHSCGTNLYGQTKDLRVVQETLRQKDPKVTAKYAHVHERMENRVTGQLTDNLDF